MKPETVNPSQEELWLSVLAHASIGFALLGISFLLGIAINAIIWVRSRRSPYLSMHAEQAALYQLTVFIIDVLFISIWVAALIMVFMGESTIGAGQLSMRQIAAGIWLSLIPLFIIWYLTSVFYGMYGAIRVSQGKQFGYPLFGSWARRRAERRIAVMTENAATR